MSLPRLLLLLALVGCVYPDSEEAMRLAADAERGER